MLVLPESSNKKDIKKENKLVLNKIVSIFTRVTQQKFESNFYLKKEKITQSLEFFTNVLKNKKLAILNL
jgi:hypothetical protein